MQCQEFESRLNDLLDQRLSPEADPPLTSHAQQCGACREVLTLQGLLWRGLKANRPAPPAHDFSARVVANVQPADAPSPVSRPARGRHWLITRGLALTAGAAVMLLGARLIFFRGENQPANLASPSPRPNVVEPNPAPPTTLAIRSPGAPPRNGPAPTSPVNDPSAAPPSLPPGAIASAFPFRLPAEKDYREYGQAMGEFAAHLPQTVEKLEEMDRVTPGIRPIRSSFSIAIEALLRTIPSGKEPPPAKPNTGFIGPGMAGLS